MNSSTSCSSNKVESADAVNKIEMNKPSFVQVTGSSSSDIVEKKLIFDNFDKNNNAT